ncbi:MAG: DUF2203 family protein [Planctomycetota bacterium]
MMHAYHKDDAAKLVPLLESIVTEVADRRRTIRTLERSLATEKENGSPQPVTGPIRARLASERRELRLATKELERLGCSFDEHNPNRVMIPGTDGGESGFHWDAGETEVHVNAPESTVF